MFGRLDRTDGEIRYVGRIGVRDADYEPLVIDWRAPAAEPFYRATPSQPDAGRPPPGAALLRATGWSGSRTTCWTRERADARPGGDRRGRADGGAVPGPRPHDARHRRHHPGRAGRGDPGAVPGLHHDLRRPGHRQDGGRPAPGGVPALLRPPPVRVRRRAGRRPEPRLHELHRAGAALPRRGRGHPAARSARSPPTWCGSRGDRVDPPADGRGQGQPADGRRCSAGWCTSRRQTVPLELRLTVKGHVLVLPPASCWPRSAPTCWPTTSSTSAATAAERAPAERAVADPPAGPRPGTGRVRRAGHRHGRLRDVLQRLVAAGQRDRRRWPGWPTGT